MYAEDVRIFSGFSLNVGVQRGGEGFTWHIFSSSLEGDDWWWRILLVINDCLLLFLVRRKTFCSPRAVFVQLVQKCFFKKRK